MKTKKTLVQITERNIDGCGSDASALLLVDFPENEMESALEIAEKLKCALNKIKADALRDDVCLDTDEMIQQALNDLRLSAKDAECFYIEF